MLPESPAPVAVAALLLGSTVAHRVGNGPAANRWSGRTAAAALLPAAGTVAVAYVVWTTPVSVWLWAVVAVVGVAAALAPLVDGARLPRRRPSVAEEAALGAVLDREADDVCVVSARGRIDGYAVNPVTGTVGVSEAALETLSPEEIAALVAHERAHHEENHVLVRTASSVTWLAVGSLGVAATLPGSTLTAVAVFALIGGERVVAVLVARHTEYAADARAARRSSHAAVGSLLETLAAAEGERRRGVAGLVSGHPSYRSRLARLDERQN